MYLDLRYFYFTFIYDSRQEINTIFDNKSSFHFTRKTNLSTNGSKSFIPSHISPSVESISITRPFQENTSASSSVKMVVLSLLFSCAISLQCCCRPGQICISWLQTAERVGRDCVVGLLSGVPWYSAHATKLSDSQELILDDKSE